MNSGLVAARKVARGRPKGITNLHAKHPSAIAKRLKLAGVDWVADFAAAIKLNDVTRLNMWVRLLPYLVVTQGHRKPRSRKGRVTRAALEALEELERD